VDALEEAWDPGPLLAFRKRFKLSGMAMLRLLQQHGLPDLAYSSLHSWEKKPGARGAHSPRRAYVRIIRQTMELEGKRLERLKRAGKTPFL
jgi:hypothetical protein